jgi:Ca-activated chloride channel family protein
MDIQFNNPNNAVLFWAVLLLVATLIIGYMRRASLLKKIATPRLITRLTTSGSNGRRKFRVAMLIAVACLLCLSALDPRWGTRYKEVEQQGIDTFFVLDVSRSMLAQDVRPNRLTRAATSIEDVLDVMGSDRAGLITVAGDAALTVPLTLDYGSLRLALDDISPRSVNRGGTMIGDGIRLATLSFTDDVQDHKAIVVLTDGEDMGSFPVEAAAAAAELGILVYTVGIGDANTGSRIPTTTYGQPTYIVHEGKEVWSIMNADELTNVANAGGGVFIPAGTANLDLASIYAKRIATDSGRSFDSVKLEQYIPRFQWFAIPAFIILLGDSWMSLRSRSTHPSRVEVTT